MVGTAALHATHDLLTYRGLVWCGACGAYATAAPDRKSGAKKLVATCTLHATGAGASYIRRLRRQEPPRAGMAWPLP